MGAKEKATKAAAIAIITASRAMGSDPVIVAELIVARDPLRWVSSVRFHAAVALHRAFPEWSFSMIGRMLGYAKPENIIRNALRPCANLKESVVDTIILAIRHHLSQAKEPKASGCAVKDGSRWVRVGEAAAELSDSRERPAPHFRPLLPGKARLLKDLRIAVENTAAMQKGN